MENSSTSVVVKLELGHHASLRSEKTPEGFTHDWTVFVRGPDGINIQHFIDKVVFFLHEDFPKPKRVIKEPPYQVSESGYAGFMLPIEVYFKNKEEPKKVIFNYDLYLRTFGPPVSNIRCEKLTFQNPTDDFRRKLMKAGGTAYSGGNSEASNTAVAQTYNSATATQEKGEHSSDSQKLASSKSSHRSQDKKKHTSTKEAAKNQSRASHPFTDIFGTPIKRKSSPDEIPAKQKEAIVGTHGSHAKPNKGPSSSHSSSNLASSTKESKVGRPAKERVPHKEIKETKHAKNSKHVEKESKQPNVKRQLSPPHAKHASDKKRKNVVPPSSENISLAAQPAACVEKKDTSKSKYKESKLKEKHKSKPVKSEDVSNSISSHKNEKTKEKGSTPKPGKKPSAENNGVSPLHQGSQAVCSTWADKNSNVQSEEKVSPPMLESKEDSVMNMDDFNSSPSSSISLSSLPPGGSHGPLATMMAEMEKEPLSPLSSDPGSHSLTNSPVLKDRPEDNSAADGNIIASAVEFTNRATKEEPEGQPFVKRNIDAEDTNKEKKSDVQRGSKAKKEVKKKRDHTDETKSPHEKTYVDDNSVVNSEDKVHPEIDPAYAKELRELQQKIMQSTDRGIIQKIVDVIEETGEFEITSTAFEFELLKLDQITVRKLQDCFV